jgi:hypothetical protein
MNSTPRLHNELIRLLHQMGLSDTLLASLLIQLSRDSLRQQIGVKAGKPNHGENEKL